MKKLLALLMAGAMMLSVAACGSDAASSAAASTAKSEAPAEATAAVDTAKEETAASAAETADASTAETANGEGRTFTVGFDAEYPPYGYKDESGEYTGFDLELAQEVCDRNGWALVKQPIDWDSKDMELNSGTIDCIWNGMSITPEREESMAMTFPYLNNQMIFYTRADAGIDSLEALAGKSVAVQNGSYAEELLSGDYADLAATFSEVLGFDEYLTALMDLQNGGCDAVLMDLVVGDYRINGMGATDLKAAVALTDDNYGIGFRKEDIALRDKVEELLIEMKKDGTLEKISTQWFGSDITVVPAE